MRYVIKIDPRLQIEEPLTQPAAPEVIHFSGEITEESAGFFRRDIEAGEYNAITAGQEILPVCFDTGGGCLYSLMGMIDAIDACRIKIATVIESKAMSAGAILATCGDPNYRYMGPNATIMIHSASGGMHGSLEEVENDTKELKRLYDMALERMAKNCKKKKDFFINKIREKGPEWYIGAKEAKQIGLISHIGIPVLETNITVSQKLKLK
jgi:ATP-dependent protease ClpP protease subunit